MFVNEAYYPLFDPFDPQIPLAERPKAKRYIVLKGGAGAGKSRAIAQFIYFLLTSRKDFKVLAMHKNENRIRETVFAELNTVIRDENAESLFSVTVSPFEIKCHATGSRVIFRGLEDPNTLKSISGVGLIWLEEADMFTEEDWLQCDTRMRGQTNYPYQLIVSFNPTSELSWLKGKFFDQEYPNSLVIETTYRDNDFLDDGYEGTLTNHSPAHRRVYMEGEWGRVSSDGLFYKAFDTTVHVEDMLPYDPDKPIWLTYDFNVTPHVTVEVAQMHDENTLYVIDEIALPSPRNNTKYASEEFVKRYPNHNGGVFVTGDPAGKHQDTRSEKGYNDYSIISESLAAYRPLLRVDTVAPPIIPRGNFINDIFTGIAGELKILVSRKCKVLITDLNYQNESPTGKDKRKVKNANGVMVEKYGHASDAFDYLVVKLWPTPFEGYLRAKKKIDYMLGKRQTAGKFGR